jgi:hypothetical protein
MVSDVHGRLVITLQANVLEGMGWRGWICGSKESRTRPTDRVHCVTRQDAREVSVSDSLHIHRGRLVDPLHLKPVEQGDQPGGKAIDLPQPLDHPIPMMRAKTSSDEMNHTTAIGERRLAPALSDTP